MKKVRFLFMAEEHLHLTSKLDASVLCWQWAIESMKSLIINKIILAADDFDLIGVVLRPPA